MPYLNSKNDNAAYFYCDKWIFPIIGYILYTLVFIFGSFAGMSELNIVGVFLFIWVTCIGLYKEMFKFKQDVTLLYAFLIIIYPVIVIFFSQNVPDYSYLVKHMVTYGCYILIFSSGFSPLYKRPENRYLVIALLIVLGISLLSGRYFIREEEVRLSGLFSDPNSLSLVGLSLLFFINDKEHSILRKVGIYAVVCVVLAFTATSGAYLAFVAGMAYKFREYLFKKWTILLLAILMACQLLLTPDLVGMQSFIRVVSQFEAAYQNIDYIKELTEIDFGSLKEEYSVASLTGLWRLYQWTRTIIMYISGSLFVILFGYGVGTSMSLLGSVPHNEYLRVLFEQGIVGTLLLGLFYFTIIKRLDKNYYHIIIMLGVFALTQNIIENMMFMILFILNIASSQLLDESNTSYTVLGNNYEK